jgi:eight-cysteine-cluster-containing protein
MGRTLAIAAVLFAACAPATDRDVYETGASGSATFANGLAAATLYLGGCGHFEYEKREGDDWVSQGGDLTCVWEGFAEPVAPGESVVDPITARGPGTWRLRYPVGLGCSASEPLSSCERVQEIASNEFEVVAASCVVTGCSSHVCAAEPVATTCEYLPHYACYRDARCGSYGPHGTCGWEMTPELAGCLEANGQGRAAR